MKTKNTLNKSLELSPGVPDISVAAIPVNLGGCAVVGGAAQLYVIRPRKPRARTSRGFW